MLTIWQYKFRTSLEETLHMEMRLAAVILNRLAQLFAGQSNQANKFEPNP